MLAGMIGGRCVSLVHGRYFASVCRPQQRSPYMHNDYSMKIYTRIPERLEFYYKQEIETYRFEYSRGNFQNAWRHLERAHIIAQKYPWQHTFVHWKMLQFGMRIKNGQEILGQIPRLIFGGVKSFVGKVPVGNPGGANVPPLKPFPIEEDIREIFRKAGVVGY